MNISRSLTAKRLNPRTSTVAGIILHDTAGSGTINDAYYLANDPENRHVSVDFVVLREGSIFQLNPDPLKYYTNHAGRNTIFKGLRNAVVNTHTVGIEMSHNAVPSKQVPEWPLIQVQAVADLCTHLCSQFKLTKEDISTHAKIITDGSRSDPRNFDWPNFWARFAGNPTLTLPNTGNPVPDTSQYHIVVEGDTLWALANEYHTTIETLKALNHFNSPSTLITVGQHLLVK